MKRCVECGAEFDPRMVEDDPLETNRCWECRGNMTRGVPPLPGLMGTADNTMFAMSSKDIESPLAVYERVAALEAENAVLRELAGQLAEALERVEDVAYVNHEGGVMRSIASMALRDTKKARAALEGRHE